MLGYACWYMGPVQRLDLELAPKSQLVGLDAVAGNVARTSAVNVGQRCLSHLPFFPLTGC